MSYELEYFTNEPDDIFATTFRVFNDGRALLYRTTNADDKTLAVGVFGGELSVEQTTPFFRALSDPAFESIPMPIEVLPGSVVRRLTIRFEGKESVQRFAVEDEPAHPEFERAEDIAHDLMRTAAGNPKHVLKMKFRLSDADSHKSDTEMTVTLLNPGPSIVGLAKADRWENMGINLGLMIQRADIPLEDMGIEHQEFINLGAKNLICSPGDTDGKSWLIPPGGELLLKFMTNIDLSTGPYTLLASFEFILEDEKGSELLHGELVSRKLNLAR